MRGGRHQRAAARDRHTALMITVQPVLSKDAKNATADGPEGVCVHGEGENRSGRGGGATSFPRRVRASPGIISSVVSRDERRGGGCELLHLLIVVTLLDAP